MCITNTTVQCFCCYFIAIVVVVAAAAEDEDEDEDEDGQWRSHWGSRGQSELGVSYFAPPEDEDEDEDEDELRFDCFS